ncbi:MAG: hypothetical protein KDK99_15830 [Verrucomicrobiales bacterium]|nr:hypothetical protein [Verrucomicrobiales bacterium]
MLAACGPKPKSQSEETNGSVVAPPSCAETACFLALKALGKKLKFEDVSVTLSAHQGTTSSSTLMLAMKSALQGFGLSSKGVHVDIDSLMEKGGGAILHLRLDGTTDHFACCRISGESISIYDPVLGGPDPVLYRSRDLRDLFTGYALLIQP